MTYLRCPGCQEFVAIPDELDAGEVVLINGGELETFVHDHLRHLGDDLFFEVMEPLGDSC